MRLRSPDALVRSRTDWLGHVPADWHAKPLRSMYARVKDVGHPEEQMLSVFREHGVVVKEAYENINRTADDRSIYQLVHPGWLIANRMKAWQGSVGISPYRGIVSGHYICFSPRHHESNRYLNWLFRSDAYKRGYGLLSRGVRIGQAEIDNAMYGAMPVLLPPPPEQADIADYLDRETAQIDALIGKQERLIETLRERRRAATERAVTAGVDGDARLSSSPIDWINQSPSHWGSGRLKHHAQAMSGGTPDTDDRTLWAEGDDSDAVPWVSISDMSRREVVGSTKQHVTRDALVAKGLPLGQPGTVLFAMYASVGEVAHLSIPATWNQALLGLTPKSDDLDSHYLGHVLRSMRQRMLRDVRSNTQSNLNASQVANFQVPLPPREEQRRIVEVLDQEQARMDTLIAKAERFIVLARERRSALITAAVSGQIDVRTAA